MARRRGGAAARWRGGAVARRRGGAVARWRDGAVTSDSRLREPAIELAQGLTRQCQTLGKFGHSALLKYTQLYG